MKPNEMTDEQLLAAMNKVGKDLQHSSPHGIAAEKLRAILVRELHRRKMIGYPSGRKFRVK